MLRVQAVGCSLEAEYWAEECCPLVGALLLVGLKLVLRCSWFECCFKVLPTGRRGDPTVVRMRREFSKDGNILEFNPRGTHVFWHINTHIITLVCYATNAPLFRVNIAMQRH